MRADHGRADIGMAQQLLDGPDVRAAFEQCVANECRKVSVEVRMRRQTGLERTSARPKTRNLGFPTSGVFMGLGRGSGTAAPRVANS